MLDKCKECYLDNCKECYEDNKTPDKNSCEQCGNNYKRLEQELKEEKCYLEKIIKENENLKEENAILREFLNQYQEETEALKSYETYKVWLNNEYRKENEKIKEALKEIKNISDNYNLTVCECREQIADIVNNLLEKDKENEE